MLEKDFFTPSSLAVVGASRNHSKLGYILLKNILDSGYKGKVYPVNPGESEVMGLTCYPRVTEVPEMVHMALVALPWQATLETLSDCAQKGIRRVVIISSGFKETGVRGSELEKEMLSLAREHGIRLLGPNCLGFIDTSLPLNATFASGMPLKGSIAVVAQSGAMRQSFWDWAQERGAGLSKFISLGNETDITEADVLELLKDDDQTKVVLAYLEGIADGERFRRIAVSLTRCKPLIVVKAGNTTAGSRATISHTGAMAGVSKTYDALFKQTGVIRAQTPEQLFDFAFGLSCQPLLCGDRLAVVTNAGGPGVMASDAIERSGLMLASFNENTISRLRRELPPFASLSNPVDLTGSVTPDNYEAVLRLVLSDPNVDGALVILCSQGPVNVGETAASVITASTGCGKPVFANFMGARDYCQELEILTVNGIPNYPLPERAVDGFRAMNQYRLWRARKSEAPEVLDFDRNAVRTILDKAKQEGVEVLGGPDAMRVLGAYGFTSAKFGLAQTPEEAVKLAEEIGYPVVMKIVSPDIIHKTEVSGVRVDLESAEAVRSSCAEIMTAVRRHRPEARVTGLMVQAMASGREVILGVKRDPSLGALLMFGIGGIYTEVMEDVSFRVAPITRQDAVDMIHEIGGYPLLCGVRGAKPADTVAIANCLLQLSQLALDFSDLTELDINPLMVNELGKGAIAVDCRISIK